MRTRIFPWITTIALLANLVGAGLAPRPVAAGPAALPEPVAASRGVAPAWYEGLAAREPAALAPAPAELSAASLLPAWMQQQAEDEEPAPAPPVDIFPPWMTLSPPTPHRQVAQQSSGDCPVARASIAMALTLPPDPVSRGNTTGEVFTVTVTNNGAISIPYVSLLIAPNDGFYYLADSASATSSLTPTIPLTVTDTGPGQPGETSTITVTNGAAATSLASEETMTFTFKLATDANARSGQRLEVTLQSGDETPAECQTVGKNVRTVRGNLVVSKQPATQDGSFGDVVTWTVTLRNTGLGDVYGAIFTDTGGIGLRGLSPTTTAPITLTPETSQAYTVTATVASCNNLTNTVEASWSIGNQDETGTADNPVSDGVDIVYLVDEPDLSVEVGPLPSVGYCDEVSATVPVTITNDGCGARNLRLRVTTGLDVEIAGDDWTGDGYEFSFQGGDVLTDTLCRGETITVALQVSRDTLCEERTEEITVQVLYDDPCDLFKDVVGAEDSESKSLPTDAPTLDLSKDGPRTVYAGQSFTYTVTASGVNQQSILTDGLVITDTVPAVLTIDSTSVTSGITVTDNSIVTWEPDLGDGDSYSETLFINVSVPGPDAGGCGAGGSFTNQVAAVAHVCPDCDLVASAELTTYVEDYLEAGNVFTKTASPIEPCAPAEPQVITVELSITEGITWTDTIYTDTLGQGQFAEQLQVVSDTQSAPTVFIDDVDRTGDVNIDLGPPLVIDFSAIGTYSQTADIRITYAVTAPVDAIEDDASSQTAFLFSEFTLGGDPGTACDGGSTGYVGTEVTLRRGDLNVSVAPATLRSCQENTITITVSGAREDTLTDNVVVTFTAQADDVFTHTLATFTGAFDGIDVVSATVNNTVVFTFTNGLDEEGTISFPLYRHCGVTGPISATLSYQDQCRVTRTATGSGGSVTTESDVSLFGTPDSYVINQRTARWRFYVSNGRDQTASQVTITNTLPIGYAFYTYTVSSANVTTDGIDYVTGTVNSREVVTFTIPEDAGLEPGLRVQFDVTATVASCVSPAVVDIALFQECGRVRGVCDGRDVDRVTLFPGPTSLLSSNDQTANLPLCEEGTIELTVKNTSAASAEYDFVITNVLTNATYVDASAFVTVTDRAGAIVTGLTSNEGLKNIPFTPTVTSLNGSEILTWTVTSFDPGTPQCDVLAERAASDVIRIRFQVATDCSSREALVQSSVEARDVCDFPLTSLEDSQALDVDEPQLTVDKTGRNATTGSEFDQLTDASAEDVVVWSIVVTNVGDQPVFNLLVTDTVPSNFTITDTHPDTATWDNGRVTWEMTGTETVLAAGGGTETFYITGTVKSDECFTSTTNIAGANYGCSEDDFCLIQPVSDEAELRTRPELTVSAIEGDLSTCGGVITVTIGHDGPPAHDVVLTHTLPDGFVYESTVFSTTQPTEDPSDGAAEPVWKWTGPITETTIAFRVRNEQITGDCDVITDTVSTTATVEYNDTCTDTGPYTHTLSPSLEVGIPELEVDKTPPQQAAGEDQQVTWTIRVTNTGNGPAPNVVITDVLGSGFSNPVASVGTYVGGPNSPITSNDTITWTPAFTLPADAVWTAQVTATVEPTGDHINTVTATATCGSGCAYIEPISEEAHVTLLEEFAKGPPIQTHTIGSMVVFTFTGFLWDQDALYQNLTLTDTLPEGLGYLSSTLVYTYNGPSGIQVISYTPTVTPGLATSGDVVWELGDLSGTVHFNGVITAVVQDIDDNFESVRRTNTLRLTYTDDDRFYEFEDTADVGIIEPNLDIEKYSTPSPTSYVGAGDLITYFLTITNDGGASAYDIVVSDTLPFGVTYVTSTVGSTAPPTITFLHEPPVSATGTITWELDALWGTLENEGQHGIAVITMTGRVTDTIGAGATLTNTAAIPYYDAWPGVDPPGLYPDEERTYVDGEDSVTHRTPRAEGTKEIDPATATIGDEVVFTLTGPFITATLYSVVVTDVVDSRLTVDACSVVGETLTKTCSIDGNVVTATWDSVPAQTTSQLIITSTLTEPTDAKDGHEITNTASFEWQDLEGNVYTDTLDEVKFDVVEPKIELTKDVASSTGTLTDLDGTASLTYTLRLTNVGTSPAYSLYITDTVPEGISVTAQYGGDARSGPVIGQDTLTWTVGSLSHELLDNKLVLTYTARITEALSKAALENTVDLLYHSLTDTIDGVRSYTATDDAEIETAAPTVSKSTDPAELRIGDVVTYNLVFTVPAGTVGMDGDSYLEDTLPSGVWYITDSESLTYSPDNVDPITYTDRTTDTANASQVVRWTFSDPITSLQDTPTVVTITFQAQATGVDANGDEVWEPYDQVYTITNTVKLYQDGQLVDEDEAENQVIQPVLEIAKTATPPPGSLVGAGDYITYTLTITNSGHGPAYDIEVEDTLPQGIDYVRTISMPNPSTATIDIDQNGQEIRYTVSELAAGPDATMTITIVARVTDTIGANLRLTNTAVISYYDSQPGDGPDEGLTPTQREYDDGEDSVEHRTVDAALTKEVMPDYATLGDIIIYTIRVPNPVITATLNNVTVTDHLDARLHLQSVDGGSDGTEAQVGNAFTVTYASISHSEQRLITVTAVVSDPLNAEAGDVITNQATLDHRDGGPTLSNETPFTVTEPSLSLVKTSDPSVDPVGAGDAVTYTVRITNTDTITTSAAYNIVITDTLPDGLRQSAPAVIALTINGVDETGYTDDYSDPNFVVTLPTTASIPRGGTLLLTYTTRVDSDVGPDVELKNAASVTWSSLPDDVDGDRDYGPIDDDTTLNVGPSALELTKAADPGLVFAGSLLTYTITVTNTDVVSATDVVITDTVPDGTTFVSATPTYDGPDADSVIAWTLDTLDRGERRTLTMTVRVLSTVLETSTITNTAWLTTGQAITGTDTVTTPVTAAADLALTKSSHPDEYVPGETLTYTLVYTNHGPSDAQKVCITDTLPVSVTYEGVVSPPDGWPGPTHDDSTLPATLTWCTDTLSFGAFGTLVFTVTVDSDALDPITNTAVISATTHDPDSGNNEGQVDNEADPKADLLAIKIDSTDPVTAGTNLTYTLTITNVGPSDARDVVVTDTLPSEVTFVSADPSQDETDPLVWNLGTLPAGHTRVLTLVVTVQSWVTDTFTNTAEVGSTTHDADLTNNEDDEPTQVTTLADVSVDKAGDPDTVYAGENLTYTLTVANDGPSDALNVTVTDTLPAEVEFLSADPTQISTEPLVWHLGTLEANETRDVTVVVRVPSWVTQTFTNTVVVTTTTPDADPDNNQDDDSTEVQTRADVAITKTADQATVVPGESTLVYTLVYTNYGPSDAMNVVITDTLPDQVTFESADPDATSTDPLVWNIGPVNAGEGGSIDITVTVNAWVTQTFENLAVISTTTEDPKPDNNADTDSTNVTPSADLALTKVAEPDPYRPGEPLTYTLELVNHGPSYAQDVVLTDTLDANTFYVTSTVALPEDPSHQLRTCGYVSPTLTCHLHTVAVGERVTVTLVTTTSQDYTGVISNTAVVDSVTEDPDPISKTDSHQSNPLIPVGGATRPLTLPALPGPWLRLIALLLLGAAAVVWAPGTGKE